MRKLSIVLALSTICGPVSAQDFLGRFAQGAAETAAQRLAARAVDTVTRDRAAPVQSTAPSATPQSAPPPAAGGSITIRNGMSVVSSDGVVVADVMHVDGGTRAFQPWETFFTADNTYRLRRIYGREATVSGGSVRLNMTAGQYRARGQNPDQ